MRRRTPVRPRKPSPGDHVAILSPSFGLPALFPRPYELGLRRLREDFGLVPIEYPTTRRMGAAVEVSRILRSMGERGLLARFSAVLVGRAKSWSFARRTTLQEKEAYRRDQRDAVVFALDTYARDAMAVFDVDLGHTDPQLVIPVGGTIRVDGVTRRITVEY